MTSRHGVYALRDLAGRRIPKEDATIEIPEDATPRQYRQGVFIFGSMFWKAEEIAALTPLERARLLKIPHKLLYGRGQQMLMADQDERVMTVDQLVAAVGRVLAA